jgi:Monooxygenase af470-like
VEIFHETYIVERGNFEAIYSNMPVFGQAKATEHVRGVGGRETAWRRLMRGENEPAVPSPE